MKTEFDLYTDGSCSSKDGLGGYCANLIDNRTGERYSVFGSSNLTSVPRQEFTALLHGLELIFEIMDWGREKNAARGSVTGLTIGWYCDREDLVKSVDQRRTGYKRRATPDLWRRLEYFEQYVRIIPIKVPRNTLAFQHLADIIAGENRQFVKGYVNDPKIKHFNTLKGKC